MTSHAAVVARGMGTCCVSGCEEIKMNEEAKTFTLAGQTFAEGDYISLDGSTGNIYGEDIPTVEAEITGNFETFMAWADAKRSLKVRTNADTPHDAQVAIDFGAEGIGLTRTEHMFFEADRIMKFRKMIMSDTVEERGAALDGIAPIQKEDFKGIYKAMKERPVTIRLLDPPLHEFMPNTEEEFVQLAEMTGKTVEELKIKARGLHELNPMMGHRGCRLAVSYPEIARMQATAIMEAAVEVSEEEGINIVPEIMIPLIGEIKELKFVKNIVVEAVEKVFEAKGRKLEYLVGTMIEIPRAALTADEIATEAEFFSFGTNDLIQMTFGLSRDDAGKILADYIDKNIYEVDPTARLDRTGVGQLMKWAVEKAKPVRPDIHLGICGEHGGDPYSVEFCHLIGLDYVSCSPYRVPIARLAAAQAQLQFPR
ncbi:MAG: pyruvate, phosphate dikinase, partial [Anaerotignum sp.]|nr:pyruvate, phosphate dikinase [Anaerotignum sp.]